MNDRRIGPELKSLMNSIARYVAKEWPHSMGSMTEMHTEILRYLMENRGKVIVQKDLEQVFTIRKSTVSRMLRLMEQRGMVNRLSIEGDARQKRIVPTDQFCSMGEKMREGAEHFEDRMQRGISDDDLNVFFKVIDQIKENIQ